MASGGWFKKLWSVYSKEEQTEYKQPHDQQPALPAPKSTPPKKKAQQPSHDPKDSGDEKVLSDDDDLGSGEEGDKEKSEEEAEVASEPTVSVAGRPSVGEKSPRYEIIPSDFKTWAGCLKIARQRLTKERDEQIKDSRDAEKFDARLKEAQQSNPDVNAEDFDCSSASEFADIDYDSGFERIISEEADAMFERQTKLLERNASSGSAGSKGKKKKFEL